MTAIPSLSVEDVRLAMLYLDDADRAELLSLINGGGTDIWYSLPGPQSEARYCEADITGYGGAAGGGKTDLACGLSIVDHKQTTIFRNEISQLEAVKERFEELLGSRRGFNGQTNVWRVGKGHRIRFGGFPNPGDEGRYQGNPNDLVVFDEAAEMREAAVRFVIGWNRSAKRKQRTRIVLTFNPPTKPEGRWIVGFFGPWLDKRHPLYPATPGELLWCTTDPDGQDYWLTDARQFVWRAGVPCYDFDPAEVEETDVITPLSRTFIPAKLKDNPFLLGSAYLARLQQFPEPLRSQMLNGDFEAGMKDDDWQVIPTAWIEQSMTQWKLAKAQGPAFSPGPMDSMGVDVARGGRDKFVISRRHGRFFDDLIRYKGPAIDNGPKGAALVVKHRRNQAPVHVDVIGYGASTHDSLITNNVQSVPIDVSSGSHGRALAMGLEFANKRAELVWRLMEALNPEQDDPIMLPDDLQLSLDLAAYRYSVSSGKISIWPKAEMKKRIGRSPDDGDAVCLALLDTVKEEPLRDQLIDLALGSDSDNSEDLWWGRQ